MKVGFSGKSAKFHILETGSYGADKIKRHFQAKIYHERELNVHFCESNGSCFKLSWKTKQQPVFECMRRKWGRRGKGKSNQGIPRECEEKEEG